MHWHHHRNEAWLLSETPLVRHVALRLHSARNRSPIGVRRCGPRYKPWPHGPRSFGKFQTFQGLRLQSCRSHDARPSQRRSWTGRRSIHCKPLKWCVISHNKTDEFSFCGYDGFDESLGFTWLIEWENWWKYFWKIIRRSSLKILLFGLMGSRSTRHLWSEGRVFTSYGRQNGTAVIRLASL